MTNPTPDARPEWSDVTLTNDLSTLARSLKLVLAKWAAQQDTIERLTADRIRLRTHNDALAAELRTACEDRARLSGRVEDLHRENRELRAQLATTRPGRRALATLFSKSAA